MCGGELGRTAGWSPEPSAGDGWGELELGRDGTWEVSISLCEGERFALQLCRAALVPNAGCRACLLALVRGDPRGDVRTVPGAGGAEAHLMGTKWSLYHAREAQAGAFDDVLDQGLCAILEKHCLHLSL